MSSGVRTGMHALVVVLATAGTASAGPCPPAAALRGDPALVAAVTELLAARGITTELAGCPAVHVELERRDGTVVVIGEDDRDARVVSEPTTAATVIESWTRNDIGAPLLAVHSLAVPTIIGRPAAPAVPPRVHLLSSRGVQVFAAAETAYASDRTEWFGSEVGACIMLGPVCAAARARFDGLAWGPGRWSNGLERYQVELLLGGDIPIRIGRAMVTPGFGAGVGWMHTDANDTAGHSMQSESGGLRADVHAALSWPLLHHLALDLSVAADMTQATHVETEMMFQVPDEPRMLYRVAVGLRYGGL